MAHYAIIDAQNIVTFVHVGRDEDDLVESVENWEEYYAPTGFTCKRTSYNTSGGIHLTGGAPFRKNFAGVGFTYDQTKDAFIPPKPFESWILNENSCLWEAPTPHPSDGHLYRWDEEVLLWKRVAE